MTENSKKPPMGRRIRLVLFVSLALNLVVIGLVAGVVFNGGPPPRGASRGFDTVLPYSRAFTEDQRRDLRRELRKSFAPSKGDKRGAGMVESYREALDVLRQDPFERARFDGVVNKQRALAEKRHGTGQDLLAKFLEAMTPEERAAYADRLETEITNMSKRRKHWGKD
ncbi:periplasmic heavy metal sensor [uncultured Pelagimonas sp.]|uniref:periplasmic heavy metal sensor n=1 Tax=uncultured Pelagimonas sp. TaxID=1618102 RepID=UPI00260840EC|nr:periplasmic heavy metal sensor [uncultured Pelagimonas sp.]